RPGVLLGGAAHPGPRSQSHSALRSAGGHDRHLQHSATIVLSVSISVAPGGDAGCPFALGVGKAPGTTTRRARGSPDRAVPADGPLERQRGGREVVGGRAVVRGAVDSRAALRLTRTTESADAPCRAF